MPGKSNGKKSASTRRVAASSSPSADRTGSIEKAVPIGRLFCCRHFWFNHGAALQWQPFFARKSTMIKVGIVGGTGYTGVELLRLLTRHPQVELKAITSRKEAGMPVADMFTK